MKLSCRPLLALFAAVAFVPAQSATFVYTAYLDGPSEFPPNSSPATGSGVLTIDNVANTMRVEASFTGLLAPTTVAHIHGPTAVAFSGTAGIATQTPTLAGFPVGVASGAYDATFDMTLTSSFNPVFLSSNGGVGQAWAALMGAVADGKAYLNIHTSQSAGGEIRGFYTPVPEPATMTIVTLGALAIVRSRRLAKK